MVNFLDDQSDAKRFAALLADYDRRLRDLERTSKAAYTSIEGGTLDIYTEDGTLAGSVGVQPDGGIALVPEPAAAVPPPTPGAPLVAPALAGLVVTWDGWWDDSNAPPTDFAALQVHLGPAADFTPEPVTLAAAITDVTGGSVTVAVEGYEERWVRLIALSTAGLTGAPSVAVAGKPRQAVEQDLIDGIVTEVKLAENAVTEAKIALGAVGTTALADGAILTEKLADNAVKVGKLAENAVTGPAIAANAVVAGKIATDAVTAREIAAGSVTAEKLTIIGGSNLLSDPSFEGAYTAAQVAGIAYASQDKTMGNGSPASIKIDCVAAAPSTFQVPVTNVPVLPGDQLYLAVDYWVSSDWNGTEINLQARWDDAAGTRLTFGKALTSTPARETWTRMTATVTAPALAANARIRLESAGTTLGAVRFDNAAVRPVVAGVQIADGSVTAPKILAGAITTDKLMALGVTAEKIAALAITADKIAALSVTADKLAVNSVTATKIAAGVIDATHIKAGSLTADRLSLGTDGNLIADPSFEGAVTAQRVAGNTAWSVVAGGNGTAQALRNNAASSLEMYLVGPIPAVPGQKMYLAVDYLASADWAGDRVSIYAEWRNAAGTSLGVAVITSGSGATVKEAWTRIAGVASVAAPANTTQVVVRLKSVSSTAGTVTWDNAEARYVTASGFAGQRAEISPMGLQLYDDAGEEAVALVTGRPNYLTLSTDGVPVATIDQDGAAGFQRLAVADTLTIGGADLSEYLNLVPRGIQAIDYQITTRTASGTEMGFVELAADIDETRMYRFVFSARANPSAGGGELQLRLRDGGTGTPTINSTQKYISVAPMPVGNSFTSWLEHIESGPSLGAGTHRFLITFMNSLGPSGQTCEMYGAVNSRGYFYIEDIGPYIPETGGYNDGGGTTAPTPKKVTKTYACSWSGSYAGRGSYNSYYKNSCYQGYYSSTNGTQASLIGFPSSLSSDLSGATINKAEVYLYFDHWYANAGGKAVIKAHSHASRPATFSSDSEGKTISWARNEGKWVDITSVFDSTKWRGIALDPNSTSSTYYGRARGYGQTNPPKLRVTYTK
ncbi:hypothetical protein SAMN05216483_6737 [Streptomyces sp. 2131.1]|uniref:hypothetical protein n=1 Tax=Streptomyces sp. 2131.1 TaxID=1855346 RepID=UPI00089B08A8|nr:hypothetical protein [Streptomyces sp. 2131.1]SEE84050.1 hypothetical protein SAMN05216483_6737 [Streptomyces sp. 2131.1]